MTGNGITSIQKTSTVGLVDTYTITYTNGNTTTFEVTNGQDGEVTQAQLDEQLDVVNAQLEKHTNTLYTNEEFKSDRSILEMELTTKDIDLKITEIESNKLEQESSLLPEEYQQVEYIESTGTQYIDTGVTIFEKLFYDITIKINDAGGNYGRYSSNSRGTRIIAQYLNSNLIIYYGTENNYYAKTITNDILAKKNIKIIDNKLYINNELIESFSSNIKLQEENMTFLLFAQSSIKGFCNIYSAKLYNNDTLIRNFIPCYRKSDNEIGLYDLVNNVFYTNQGTGTFLKGSDVTLPTPDYPQEVEGITGDITGRIRNKNFFPSNLIRTNLDLLKPNEDGSIRISNLLGNQYYVNVFSENIRLPKNDYRLKLYVTGTFNGGNLLVRDINNNTVTQHGVVDGNVLSINNSSIGNLQFYLISPNTDCTIKFELEQGTIVPISYTKPATSIMLSLGTKTIYKGDKIVYRNNKWQWALKWREVILDGTESSWIKYDENTYYNNTFLTDAKKYSSQNIYGYSNKVNQDNKHLNYNYIGRTNIDNGLTIKHVKTLWGFTGDTLAEFKEWLSENTITVVYELAETQYTDITDATLLSQLNSLLALKQYNDKTYIEFDEEVYFKGIREYSKIDFVQNIQRLDLNWKQIQAIVQSGNAREYFNIGDQIMTTWTDTAANTEYEVPLDIVSFEDVTILDENEEEKIVPRNDFTMALC